MVEDWSFVFDYMTRYLHKHQTDKFLLHGIDYTNGNGDTVLTYYLKHSRKVHPNTLDFILTETSKEVP